MSDEKEPTQEEQENKELLEQLKSELEQLKVQSREVNEAKIKAEAERDILKNFNVPQTSKTQNTVTEEQWKTWEEATGLTRQQIMANAQIAQGQISEAVKPIEESLRTTQEEKKKLEEQIKKMDFEKKSDRVYRDFYKKNPVMERYEKDVNEFLADYPDETRNDPEKLTKALEKASVYIKGKVGEKIMNKNNSFNSPRFENPGNVEQTTEETEYNFDGMEDYAKRTMQSIIKNQEDEKVLKQYESGDGKGVKIRGDKEWEEAKPRFNR